VDAGFGDAVIGALSVGGVAVARYEATRLVRGCLEWLRARGRTADELAGVVGAFIQGADADVAKALTALPDAVKATAAAQLDEALASQDGNSAMAEATNGPLVEQAELVRDKLVKAGLLIQSNTGALVYRPKGPVAIGPDATAIGKLKVKGDVSFGGGRRAVEHESH